MPCLMPRNPQGKPIPIRSRGEATAIDANTPQQVARFHYRPSNIGQGD